MEQALSLKQKEFVNRALNNENVYLTGKAGTGKTTVVKKVIKDLRERRRNVVVVAPTGIAASNVGGSTLYSLFSIPIHGILTYDDCLYVKSQKRRLFQEIDTIIFDEVSMLRPDILDAINWTLIKNGCRGLQDKQLIFVGDLKQLPTPLNDNGMAVLLRSYATKYFLSAQIFDKIHFNIVELDEVKRQSDLEFIEALNVVRDGGKSPYFKKFVHSTPKGVILAPYNSLVNTYNLKGLESITGDLHKFTAKYEGSASQGDFNLEMEVSVKDGCNIMYLVNSQLNNLKNGSIGVFRVKNDGYFIELDNKNLFKIEPVELTKKEYVLNEKTKEIELIEIGSIKQMPIKLAYAMTIHKSQGLTFEEVTIDLSMPCFQEGQLYTALSRVTGPSGLRIILGNRG